MSYEKDHLANIRRAALMGVAITALIGLPSYASAQEVETIPEAADVEEDDDEDSITVTGSRARRSTFDSIAPLQVITADTIRSAGLVDTGEILKQQTVVTGVQLDTNINNSFVTDGGPGASNVALRGLGADRTLVMVNGRRLAPSGVEGAPALVDLNMIPSSMIARVDTLLDGAGSVYGSDAVAGVINIILRTDFEGVRFEATGRNPFEAGAESGLLSFLVGGQTGNGNYLFAGEYSLQTPLTLNDRAYAKSDAGIACSLDIEYVESTGQMFRNCDGALANLEFRLRASPFATGAPFGNTGFNFMVNDANLSEINTRIGRAFLLEGADEIINRLERYSMYFSANQGIDLFGHSTNIFTEASYSNRQAQARNGFAGQLFPTVPAGNPFNILPGVPLVPVIASPIPRSNIDTEVNQAKFLIGMNGELNFGRNWDYELYASYTRSQGYSSRPAVLEERLALSLATTVQNPDGTYSCGNNLTDLFGFVTAETCVPINLFAPSLYDPANPQFATQAELDYLSGTRTATTFNDQKLLGGYVTGPIASLPAGDLNMVLGFEYRADSVDTRTDTIAATGGAAGFFADQPSRGTVSLFELFGEAIIPLAADQPFVDNANLELAGRYIDHEFFGSKSVYSIKGNWAPTDFLNFRGTYGTSFRAPGLRELFLGGQSSFASAFVDPCLVPPDASPGGVYDPSQDTRLPVVLANCIADGVDPTSLGLGGAPSVEAFTAGNNGLDAETSTSVTAGFVLEQPFTERYDLRFGMNYFNVKVSGATADPGAGFILGQCYNSTNFPNDPFCLRRERDPNTGFLVSVDTTPFNLAFFRSEGLDFNLSGSIDFSGMGREWTFSGDTQITRQLSSEFQNLDSAPIGDRVGDFGTPKWRSVTNLRLASGAWTGFWRVVHIGSQEDLNTLTGEVNVSNPDGRFAETTGLFTPADKVVQSVDDYFLNTASIRYETDTWSVTAGLNNVFDVTPPMVDQNVGAALGASNVPLGTGYDLIGRSAFINLVKEF